MTHRTRAYGAVLWVAVLALRSTLGCTTPSEEAKAVSETCSAATRRADQRFAACAVPTPDWWSSRRDCVAREALTSCLAACVQGSTCARLGSLKDPTTLDLACEWRCSNGQKVPECPAGKVPVYDHVRDVFDCTEPGAPDASSGDGGSTDDGGADTASDGGCGAACAGVTLVAAGDAHSCAVVGGTVRCWGGNGYQQGGVATPSTLPSPTPASPRVAPAVWLSAGTAHTCALVGAGDTWCWGRSAQGQVGAGGTQTNTPTFIGLAKATAVSAGDDHTCAVANGAAWCWGSNAVGKLGTGAASEQPKETPQRVPGLPSGVTAISAGGTHSCAIVSGAVKCWGSGEYGQLGSSTLRAPTPIDGPALSGVTAIAAGTFHTCAIAGGAVKCWGKNDHGQLGNGTTDDSAAPVDVIGLGAGVTALSSSPTLDYTCAIAGGAAKCWGENPHGQLGVSSGATPIAKSPVDVQGLGSGVTHIDCGSRHTCAVVRGGVKCWGANEVGQLGNGAAGADSPTPVDVPL